MLKKFFSRTSWPQTKYVEFPRKLFASPSASWVAMFFREVTRTFVSDIMNINTLFIYFISWNRYFISRHRIQHDAYKKYQSSFLKLYTWQKEIWVYHIVTVTLYVCNCTPVRVYYEMCWHGDKFQPSTHVIILVKASNIMPKTYNGNIILENHIHKYRFIRLHETKQIKVQKLILSNHSW